MARYRAEVRVMLKEGILDPQGRAVRTGLAALGLGEVTDVRVGRYILVELEAAGSEQAREAAEAMCRRLLANPVLEDYQVRVAEVGS